MKAFHSLLLILLNGVNFKTVLGEHKYCILTLGPSQSLTGPYYECNFDKAYDSAKSACNSLPMTSRRRRKSRRRVQRRRAIQKLTSCSVEEDEIDRWICSGREGASEACTDYDRLYDEDDIDPVDNRTEKLSSANFFIIAFGISLLLASVLGFAAMRKCARSHSYNDRDLLAVNAVAEDGQE